MSKPVQLNDYVTSRELAKDLGVTVHSVLFWLERKKLRCKPFYVVVRKLGYVRLDVAATYSEGRETEKPKGWLALKGVLSELDCHGYNLLSKVSEQGKIEVKSYRGAHYISPRSAQRLRLAYRDTLPLPGWVLLAGAELKLKLPSKALTQWARRNVSLRKYRHPETGQLALYLKKDDLKKYLDMRKARMK